MAVTTSPRSKTNKKRKNRDMNREGDIGIQQRTQTKGNIYTPQLIILCIINIGLGVIFSDVLDIKVNFNYSNSILVLLLFLSIASALFFRILYQSNKKQ